MNTHQKQPFLQNLSTRTVHTLSNTTIIGRHQDCNLVLKSEKGASRKHARITVQNDSVVLMDLGSLNGTLVNGREISRAVRLSDGDIVIFDEQEYLFTGSAANTQSGSDNVTVIANKDEIGRPDRIKPAIRIIDSAPAPSNISAEIALLDETEAGDSLTDGPNLKDEQNTDQLGKLFSVVQEPQEQQPEASATRAEEPQTQEPQAIESRPIESRLEVPQQEKSSAQASLAQENQAEPEAQAPQVEAEPSVQGPQTQGREDHRQQDQAPKAQTLQDQQPPSPSKPAQAHEQASEPQQVHDQSNLGWNANSSNAKFSNDEFNNDETGKHTIGEQQRPSKGHPQDIPAPQSAQQTPAERFAQRPNQEDDIQAQFSSFPASPRPGQHHPSTRPGLMKHYGPTQKTVKKTNWTLWFIVVPLIIICVIGAMYLAYNAGLSAGSSNSSSGF